MPVYSVTSPSGQTLEIEGERPPTEKELDDIFAKAAPSSVRVPVEQERRPRMTENEVRLEIAKTILGAGAAGAGLPNPLDVSKRAATTGIRAGGPALGQALGAPLAPFTLGASVPALGFIGGLASEAAALALEGEPVTKGKLLAAGTTGAIPGASLAKAGIREVGKEALKYGAGSLLATTIEKEVDEGRLPTVTEAAVSTGSGAIGAPIARVFSGVNTEEALNQVRDQSFRDVRKWGIVVPPSELGKGSDTISSIAGKAATQQQAAKQNQFGWQRAARSEIGLSDEALPITRADLREIRQDAGAPYREIQTIQREAKQQLDERIRSLTNESDVHELQIKLNEPAMKQSLTILDTLAKADVDALKSARDSASRLRTSFFAGNPNAYEPWQNAKAQAAQLEDYIERAAASLKDENLLNRLRASREKIAKTYSVEESLNPGNGFVDPAEFGRQLLNGEPISGNLEKIAKFQLAFRREAVEAGRVPAPGVGNVGAMASTMMASRGDTPGVIGAVANATLGRAARPFLLSDLVQDSMLTPNERQRLSAAMARFAAENLTEDLLEPAAK